MTQSAMVFPAAVSVTCVMVFLTFSQILLKYLMIYFCTQGVCIFDPCDVHLWYCYYCIPHWPAAVSLCDWQRISVVRWFSLCSVFTRPWIQGYHVWFTTEFCRYLSLRFISWATEFVSWVILSPGSLLLHWERPSAHGVQWIRSCNPVFTFTGRAELMLAISYFYQ